MQTLGQTVPESNRPLITIDAPIIETSEYVTSYSPWYARELTMKITKEEHGGFSAQCVELPAAITQGETLDETFQNLGEAIALVLQEIGGSQDFMVVPQDLGF